MSGLDEELFEAFVAGTTDFECKITDYAAPEFLQKIIDVLE